MNEITQASYLEHLKHAKELAMYLSSSAAYREAIKLINKTIK
jgi:hypothetical protein